MTKKYKSKLWSWESTAAQNTFVQKNVGEIDTSSQFNQHFTGSFLSIYFCQKIQTIELQLSEICFSEILKNHLATYFKRYLGKGLG